MRLHEAKQAGSPRRKRQRVGRGTGSGRGKTSGRGHNGAKSRSGWSSRNMTGGQIPLWRRLPKYGFSNAPFKKEYSIVNVEDLQRFEPETRVTPELLKEAGIVKQMKPNGVKVLGEGEVDRPLNVRANAFSKSAQAKIEAAGGEVELIPEPKKPVRRKMKSGVDLLSEVLE